MAPTYYNTSDLEKLQNAYTELFGGSEYIAHEISSEFVHTDVSIHDDNEKEVICATLGMGSRKMNAPIDFRCELVMVSNNTTDFEKMNIVSMLVQMSKFPFQNNTWFFIGHTYQAPTWFYEKYGYYAFIFSMIGENGIKLNCGNVHPLVLIPVYKDEYDAIVSNANGSHKFLEKYYEEISEDDLFVSNIQRNHITI